LLLGSYEELTTGKEGIGERREAVLCSPWSIMLTK
jgi:hypothetical protein